jgi:hypothetical protein
MNVIISAISSSVTREIGEGNHRCRPFVVQIHGVQLVSMIRNGGKKQKKKKKPKNYTMDLSLDVVMISLSLSSTQTSMTAGDPSDSV